MTRHYFVRIFTGAEYDLREPLMVGELRETLEEVLEDLPQDDDLEILEVYFHRGQLGYHLKEGEVVDGEAVNQWPGIKGQLNDDHWGVEDLTDKVTLLFDQPAKIVDHSPLKNFNYSSIEDLIEEYDLHMKYDESLEELGLWGQYCPDENLILINPEIGDQEEESIVILHEWLHAYTDLVLDQYDDFTEEQVDQWAEWHQHHDRMGWSKAEYIRSFYHPEGF